VSDAIAEPASPANAAAIRSAARANSIPKFELNEVLVERELLVFEKRIRDLTEVLGSTVWCLMAAA
jgi:hypothetical protein